VQPLRDLVAREEAYARPVSRFVGERIGTPTMNVPAGERVGVRINPDGLHLLDQDTEVAV
jgi:ABC-type sugar transport system ATPase subunit